MFIKILPVLCLSVLVNTFLNAQEKIQKPVNEWEFTSKNKPHPELLEKDYKNTIESMVFIVDNKIYRFDDEVVKNIKKDSIDSMTIIDDPNTKSTVRKVVIIKTKK